MTHQFDVIIVGAGGAGLRAAVEIPAGYTCAVLTKVHPLRSHTGAAQGGVCAALGNQEEDNPEWHAYDTVKGSDYLGDQDAIETMCNDAPRAVIELEHMGMPFSRTEEGKIAQRKFGGHTRPTDPNDPDSKRVAVMRACYSADRTGHVMLHTLYENCLKNNVNFFSEFFATELLYENGVCSGVIAIEILTGAIHTFHAKAVMFATGGDGRIWRITSNAHVGTGDGFMLTYNAGLPLEDMEFMQFHPTGLWKLGILVSEAARGEGGILRNKDGERFMERYAPTVKDLAPRDMVSRAIIQEIREGRGIKGSDGTFYIDLDLTHLPASVINEKLPEITGFARTYLGVEPTTEGVPIQPTAHYAMGGIPTDVDGQVRSNSGDGLARGFYAAGECACVSVHGANRLGTNSLLDIIVFGRRGGKAIANYLKAGAEYAKLPATAGEWTRSKIDEIKSRATGEKPAPIRTELQQIMMDDCGIFRTAKGLESVRDKIVGLRERYSRVVIDDKGMQFNTDLLEAIELGNLLDTANVVVNCALNREETRGGHAREDFPERDDKNWMKHTFASKGNQSGFAAPTLEYRPVAVTKYKPKKRVY
ncbi:MAG: succinate dehydrogenase flavoprotein subunit [Bacteroidota bacterium]|nr:succinate dehydrogenase flavoprotein subunit [Bacteroidota bacterium]MDP4233410.1 succinate dehydrogenase flavoprotein subunit [Bacteroidota bacterium]MDP4242276.1 succinate dehydrogenase flavoprotein subunit [Bacteroidota bacterium]MDP4287032.1 succinate dehydrogenase flavoprotein subunit [Bacteroidota bacterium]